jgi:hypothetical protein
MNKYKKILFLFVLFISGCSTIDNLDQKEFKNKFSDNFGFTGVKLPKKIVKAESETIFLFMVANRDPFFQLGVLDAFKKLELRNKVFFILNNEQLDFDSGSIISASVNSTVIKTNEGRFTVPTFEEAQFSTIKKYLQKSSDNKIAFIHENLENSEIASHLPESDILEFSLDKEATLSDEIKVLINIKDGQERFKKIDEASFAKINYIPRPRQDFKKIFLSFNTPSRLYEISSLIRFNYGLEYELISLTHNLENDLNPSEIQLHDIKLIDNSYENKFKTKISKSRSYTLGYDTLNVMSLINNSIEGEYRGLGSIYFINKGKIERFLYVN